jgi:acyl-CoA oxidase
VVARRSWSALLRPISIRITALGKTSNHCVVVARLITQGKDYGPHTFFVQLRDLETYEPLKGE